VWSCGRLSSRVRAGKAEPPADTYIVPALIADLGDAANWRYVEFFTANINNDHTWRALPTEPCSRKGQRAAIRTPLRLGGGTSFVM
jgi:hypothetical protein